MNVLQIIPELDAGGAERTTLEVAEAVVAAGGRALVISEGGRLEAELDALGADLVRMPVKSKNPLTMMANAGRIADLVRTEAIDIVHARSRAPAWSAWLAARRTGAAFVTTYHGTYNARSGLKRWYNSVMTRGRVTIANSEFIAEHIAQEHPGLARRIEVIARGVDLGPFDPETVEPARALAHREAWQIPVGAPVILLPARLTRWKGQLLAIEAVSRLTARDPAPVLVMAGDAQGREAYVQEIEQAAGRCGVAIRLPGHVADMPGALMAADLVLTPSIEPEAFGRSAAEAQAMGRPVIVADHGGAREVVEHGVTGWRVTPGDAQSLADSMQEAFSLSPGERAAMADAARQRVRRHFSKQALQEKTLRVYRDVLDCRP